MSRWIGRRMDEEEEGESGLFIENRIVGSIGLGTG